LKRDMIPIQVDPTNPALYMQESPEEKAKKASEELKQYLELHTFSSFTAEEQERIINDAADPEHETITLKQYYKLLGVDITESTIINDMRKKDPILCEIALDLSLPKELSDVVRDRIAAIEKRNLNDYTSALNMKQELKKPLEDLQNMILKQLQHY